MSVDIPDNKSDDALDTAKNKTREHARNLWQIVSRYTRIDDNTEPTTQPHQQPKREQHYSNTLISTLSIIPYLLVLLFGLSFFWDFDGLSGTVLGQTLQFEGLLKILSVSGLIGFSTNWLAITMLFKPAEKRPILGHGLIPAQKNRIAYRLAQAVSEDLINPEIIKKKISESNIISRYRELSTQYIKNIIDDPKFRKDIKQWVVQYVDEMIADPEIRAALAKRILIQIEEALHNKSFEKIAFKTYTFVKGQEMQAIIEEALVQIPTSVESGLDKLDDLLDQLPEKIDKNSDAIEEIVTTLLYKLINQLNVHALVEENLRSYDEQHISNIIRSATNEQLRYIQYLGAILGVIGGFVIWEPLISVIVLASLAVIMLLLDQLLYQYVSDSKDKF
ncbi:DUF445 domain-containing protein [Aliifodinibius salipaludis]|uniref:DUF445 domain-containing protein n=1 Tax=Fodinibius salipaludis TaxID=2032627 RepID=A0A2A2GF06_9BACT|nr:DUF445 family protein [Aliifodinibius salipaludis]PAU95507.1 DUF445 domain-containing protein [Aliifodinibius salipaludis]